MKRPPSLHDLGDGLLEMLWCVASDSTPRNTEDAAPWALAIAEQIYGRQSWQYASALFHLALYGEMTERRSNGKKPQFVSMTRRAIQIYRETGGPNVSYSGYGNACFELAFHFTETMPGKHRGEVYTLLRDVILFEQRHDLMFLTDDAEALMKSAS